MNSPKWNCDLRVPNADLTIDNRKLKIENGMILLLLAALLSGCRTHNIFSKPPDNHYYLNPNTKLAAIGRVAIIELDNDSSYPEISNDVTGSLFQA